MYIKQMENVIILKNVSKSHRVQHAKSRASISDAVIKHDTHVLCSSHIIVLFCLLLQNSTVAAELSRLCKHGTAGIHLSWLPVWGPGSPRLTSATWGLAFLFFHGGRQAPAEGDLEEQLARTEWEVVCKTGRAFHSVFFSSSSFFVCVGDTSKYLFLLPPQPCLLLHQLPEYSASEAQPFFLSCPPDPGPWLQSCLCRLDWEEALQPVTAEGLLVTASNRAPVLITEVWKAQSGQWRHRRPLSCMA